MIRVMRYVLLLSALAAFSLPAEAQASALSDCTQANDLDHHYSNSELQKALDNLPTDSDEYGSCREVLAGALQGGSDKGGGRPSDTGPDGKPLSTKEQSERSKDTQALAAIAGDTSGDPRTPSVKVGDETVEPGSDGLFDLASASNGLPTPLLVALIALGALALTGILVALRSRIPLLGRVPLLSKIPAPRAPFPRSSRR